MNEGKIVLPYQPLPYQRELHNDPHRFRTIVAGRRVGKTTFSVNELLKLAIKRKLKVPYWYIAPFYYQAKTIAWDMLLKYVPEELRASKPNETTLSMPLITGDKIVLKGADNPGGLEGTALGAVIIDEVSWINHFKTLWQNTVRPMLSDYEAPAIFISKPRGFNDFHLLAKAGDHNNIIEGQPSEEVQLDPDFITYRFETEQNCREHNGGYIPHEEIEAARRQLTTAAFDQEYRARFTKYTGLVYKEFNRDINVIDSFPIPDSWSIYAGMDFGSTNPTAHLWIAVDSDDNWFVIAEHYDTNKTIDYHAGVINSNQRRAVSTFGDPSGAQWISEFRERGVYITPANKETGTSGQNWVRYGIEKVNEKLRALPGHDVHLVGQTLRNGPALYVFRGCENTIREFETYRWKEKLVGQATDLNEPDQPEKANDHALDALRYFAVSYKKAVDIPEDFNVDKVDWSFK